MTSHVFNNQGPGGNETRHYYPGQTLDSKVSLENLVHKDAQSHPCEQDMEIGCDNTILPLSFEVLEREFLDEILKLAKEHNEAEDAEIARHREKIIQINTGYHEKLLALRVQQGNRREEFLRKESQTRLSEYQQAGLNHYSTTGIPDAHRYGDATSSIYGGTSSSMTTDTGCSSFIASSSAVRSTGSGTFSFNVGATASAHANQSQRTNPGSAETSASGTGSSTQSMPILFGLSASSPSFGSAWNAPLTSSSCLFNSSSSSGSLFSSGATFGMASSSASGANMASSSTMDSSTAIGSTWQTRQSPVFGSTFNSSSSSTGFAFDASVSGTGTTGTSVMFKSSTSAPSILGFSLSSTAPTTTIQAVFGNSNSGFGLSAANNNDQMNMEDSMTEDTVQSSTLPTGPVFNQPASTPSSRLFFGATTPSGLGQFGSPSPSVVNPFQFGSQPNLAAPQNPSPFFSQASGSLEFNGAGAGAGAGSFSLGTGGCDKSDRKIVMIKKGPRKR